MKMVMGQPPAPPSSSVSLLTHHLIELVAGPLPLVVPDSKTRIFVCLTIVKPIPLTYIPFQGI